MAAGIALGSDYSQLRKWRARQWQAEAGLQKRLPLHNHEDDYYFELCCEGERDAQSYVQKKAEVLSGRLSPPG
jgi:hypothetical protein